MKDGWLTHTQSTHADIDLLLTLSRANIDSSKMLDHILPKRYMLKNLTNPKQIRNSKNQESPH